MATTGASNAAGSGEPALRRKDSCCTVLPLLRRAGCPHPTANSILASVPSRRGAHRAPAPRRSALASLFEGGGTAKGRDGRSPSRRSARIDMVCSKIEVPARADVSIRPYAKEIAVVPNPKPCVGRDAHIAPRIPDAEPMVPTAGRRGRRPLQRRMPPTPACRGRRSRMESSVWALNERPYGVDGKIFLSK